jgi:hypothetical protein
MSLIQALETEAEKVFHTAETEIENLDGQALAAARSLLAEAKTAESRISGVVNSFEAEITARLKQLITTDEPQFQLELEAVLKGEAAKLLATLLALFGITVP